MTDSVDSFTPSRFAHKFIYCSRKCGADAQTVRPGFRDRRNAANRRYKAKAKAGHINGTHPEQQATRERAA